MCNTLAMCVWAQATGTGSRQSGFRSMQSSTSDRTGFEAELAATDRPLRDFALWLGILGPPITSELLRAWAFAPGVLLPLAPSAVLYAVGVTRLRHRSPKSIRKFDTLYFWFGWAALVSALISPVHAWGSVLFSAHMTQHELLMLVAAPLLVLGRPLVPFLWALPKSWAVALARWSKLWPWEKTWRTISNP